MPCRLDAVDNLSRLLSRVDAARSVLRSVPDLERILSRYVPHCMFRAPLCC